MKDNKIKQAVILAAGERKDFDRPVGFLEIEDTILVLVYKYGHKKLNTL